MHRQTLDALAYLVRRVSARMAEPNGKEELTRKSSGSGASPDGSAKTTPKMRTKKLTVDPNLTPAVTEPKPNFALYVALRVAS